MKLENFIPWVLVTVAVVLFLTSLMTFMTAEASEGHRQNPQHEAVVVPESETVEGIWNAKNLNIAWDVMSPTGDRSLCVVGFHTTEFELGEISLLCVDYDLLKRYKGHQDGALEAM